MMPIQKKPIRTHIIKIRVDDDELASIQARAGDYATAQWLRDLAMGFPLESTQRPPRHRARKAHAINPERSMLIYEVARIGNNLNQLTRGVNRCSASATPINLLVVATELDAIWKELNYVQQSFQTRQRASVGDRLLTVADGCPEENSYTASGTDARGPNTDKRDHP